MKLSFFGADQCVTGSCHCLEVGGKRILIDDIVTGDLISLEQWRKDSAPMQRIATQ